MKIFSLLLGCLFPALTVPGLDAQERRPVSLTVAANGGVSIILGDLLDDETLLDALHSGLPLRIQIVTELWSDGFFDRQRGSHEWRGSITFDPLEERYRVQVSGPPALDVTHSTFQEARSSFERNLRIPLRPINDGRYYYLANVNIETLSLSDLQELQRWLQGDLGPAVSGENDVESAIGSGVRRLFLRILNLPARRARAKTESFRFERDESEGEDSGNDLTNSATN